MLNVTIYIFLITQGIEPNPGPEKKSNLSIRTFNCNGLGNTNKLRRLLTKVRQKVKLGGIVLLQETHLKSEEVIKLYWKMNYFQFKWFLLWSKNNTYSCHAVAGKVL